MQTRNFCLQLSLVVAVFAAAITAGCGGSTARISGQVTHAGQPVTAAEVVVKSPTDADEEYFGMTTDDGSLYVGYRDKSGLTPGLWQIRVTHYTQRDGQPLPAGEAGQALRASDRAVATTYIFEQALDAGKNTLDLKLESASDTVDNSTAPG